MSQLLLFEIFWVVPREQNEIQRLVHVRNSSSIEIQQGPNDCAAIESGYTYCHTTNDYIHVTRLLLAVYMLIGNVMLLNLLIAVFT